MATEKTEKQKFARRSKEERIAEIDAKIAGYKEKIEKLEQRKEAVLNPKPRASKASGMKALIAKAKEAGLTNEEIAAKLGISID